MRRFYFHLVDGSAIPDDTGVELPSVEAAKIEAAKFAGAVLSEGIADGIWAGSPWRVVVSDSPLPDRGRTFLTLTLSCEAQSGEIAEVTSDVRRSHWRLTDSPNRPGV